MSISAPQASRGPWPLSSPSDQFAASSQRRTVQDNQSCWSNCYFMIMVQRWNPQEPSIVIPDKWKTWGDFLKGASLIPIARAYIASCMQALLPCVAFEETLTINFTVYRSFRHKVFDYKMRIIKSSCKP